MVSNVIGNRDVIHSGENGLICNSASDYADAIRKIANGEIDGRLLSEAAFEDVVNNYNIDLMAQKYSKIYKEEFKSKLS